MSYEMTDGDMPPVAPETTQRPQVQDEAIVTATTSGTFNGKVYLLQNGMKIARREDGEGLKLDICKALPSTRTSGSQGPRGRTGTGLPYNGFEVLLMGLNTCRALWVSGAGPLWGHRHESNRALE